MNPETREELSVITKVYDLILWSLPHISKFPRDRRFVLGERMERTLFDLLDILLEAKYRRRNRTTLLRANMLLERLRFQFRLAKDLAVINLKSYAYAAQCVETIGREVGGWAKIPKDAT